MGASKVERLLSKKQDIEKQIDKIQSECGHKNKVIKLVHDGRYGGHKIRWVCNDCSMKLDYPTAFEKERFWNKKA